MRIAILNLISLETSEISKSQTFEEKSSRINNIIQLKINSGHSDIERDIYVDVKNFITFYIKSLKEKQYNYDEFNEAHIIDLINRFDVDQQCNLLEHTLRESKNEHILEKASRFEDILHEKEFLREWNKLSWNNLIKLIFKASVYNGWTILISVLLCYIFCFVIYLPAPEWSIPLFFVKYYPVSSNFLLNHGSNVLMSFLDIQTDKFILPKNTFATVLIVIIKIFIISIVVNALMEQFQSRFKI